MNGGERITRSSFTLLHTPSHPTHPFTPFTPLHTPSCPFMPLHTPSHPFTLLLTPTHPFNKTDVCVQRGDRGSSTGSFLADATLSKGLTENTQTGGVYFDWVAGLWLNFSTNFLFPFLRQGLKLHSPGWPQT